MPYLRTYVLTGDGIFRIPQVIFDEDRSIPQFAGSRQRVIHVEYEWRGVVLYARFSGGYRQFDEAGRFDLQAAGVMFADSMDAIFREMGAKGPVTDLTAIREARAVLGKYRWAPTEEEEQWVRRIADDLLPRSHERCRPIPVVRQFAKPASKRRSV